ncbi:MAG: carboxypeptidase regulatory-like domain-containing protein, partial [Acidobacteria bacterium]|nr:carboxypeptidase regulatory-like domain-containing protein [Acidobacteriota bacterium]
MRSQFKVLQNTQNLRTASGFKKAAFLPSMGLAVLVFSVWGAAQSISGDLIGTVTDPSGAAVNNAQVQAININSGQQNVTKTTSFGGYRFSQLPVGIYNIRVSAQQFATATLHNVPVQLNKTGTANVQLRLGNVSTTVEVSGAAPPVDTSTAQLQTTYDSIFSQDLGLTTVGGIGAGILDLSLLSPGVTQASAMGLGTGPSVGGLRPYDNNFTIEGVDNNDKGTTGALASVPNDAVEQFVLLSNQFSPEFGHSSGGQFNTTVKSGTNSFHGSVYEYLRNRNLNAVDNFYVLQGLTKNPRFDSNRFGGTFGGPIIKSKLFFFTDFERQPVGLTATSVAPVLAPTAAGLAAIAADPLLNQTNFTVFKKYVPIAQAQAPGPCTAGVNAITFTGFSTPAANICPAGSGLIPMGPVSISAPAFQNFQNFVQSVDYNISSRDQLRLRYIYNKLDQIDTAANLPAFYSIQPFRYHLLALSAYHNFTPSLINEFRAGYNRYFFVTPAGNTTFPGLNVFPNITLLDLGGGLNIGWDPNAPQGGTQDLYQLTDNIGWNKGAHDLKFGMEWREYIAPSNFTQRAFGDYRYNRTQLFLEDFSPDNFGERSSGSTIYYGNDSAVYWYANDIW